METTKFTGRKSLVKRLTAQVGGDEALAQRILQKRGHMDAKGNLTAAGRARDRMTAEERAKDRASKRTGRPDGDFKYDVKTNQATLKKGR